MDAKPHTDQRTGPPPGRDAPLSGSQYVKRLSFMYVAHGMERRTRARFSCMEEWTAGRDRRLQCFEWTRDLYPESSQRDDLIDGKGEDHWEYSSNLGDDLGYAL
jgi:hypothetical protein